MADAIRIAQFCRAHQPPPWQPPAPELDHLQALVRRLEALKQMHQMESQRLEGAAETVVDSLKAVLSVLEQQIQQVHRQIQQHIEQHIEQHPELKRQSELLESIPGIGAATAAQLLCEWGDWTRFESARAAAAYVGLVPRLRQSGTSVRSPARLCKLGNARLRKARLRKALYFPAMSALRHNPVLQVMSQRLAATGKSKMAIIGAAMRRLVHLALGVLKSSKAFDPAIALRQIPPTP